MKKKKTKEETLLEQLQCSTQVLTIFARRRIQDAGRRKKKKRAGCFDSVK